jgi:hypothetical protein
MNVSDPRAVDYLERDPLAAELLAQLRAVPALRSIVMDITHKCNIRCTGCYFFDEKMDKFKKPDTEEEFDAFVAAEKARGTTYMTVAGGEPALMLDRLRKLHQHFRVMPFTNGLKKIPVAGFETMAIALSVWGGHETDKTLRGGGRNDIFAKALKHYRDDARVTWYYTTTAGNAHEIEPVTEEIVANGNILMYSFYEDHKQLGGRFDHHASLLPVRAEIDRMIERHPGRILTTSYVNKVGTDNALFGQPWGYDVCPTIDAANPKNAGRVANGNPYINHFRALYPDLKTARRCCIGEAHDCSSCFNVYSKMAWINVNLKQHLRSADDFFNWLSSNYMQHVFVRAIPLADALPLLPRIHARQQAVREEALRLLDTGMPAPAVAAARGAIPIHAVQ